MKKITPYLITAGVAIVAVVVVYPLIRPYVQKIPLIGGYFA